MLASSAPSASIHVAFESQRRLLPAASRRESHVHSEHDSKRAIPRECLGAVDCGISTGPEAVARTFEKIDALTLMGKRYNVFHRERQRPLHETVDHQARCLVGIDAGMPGVVPLEMETIRCNDPMQILPRRHRRGRGVCRRRSTRPADDVFLEWRRLTIRRTEKRRALFLHPCRHMRRQVVVGSAGGCCRESSRSSAAREHDAAGEQLPARDACCQGRLVGHQ